MEANLPKESTLKKTGSDIPFIKILSQVIPHLPYYALILDSDRRVIYSNDQLITDHSLKDMSSLFGKRPGDIFQCENARDTGCGNSDLCKYCGIYRTLAECQARKTLILHKSSITIQKDNQIASYEFLARCSPLSLDDEDYFFLTLTDISHENRKLMLERIFYHDVINSLGSLQGLSEILNTLNSQPALSEYLGCLLNVTEQLQNTILAQRDLTEAENHTLTIHPKKVNSSDILKTVLDSARFYLEFKSVSLDFHADNQDFFLETDPVLLSRVLINMLKNALEASPTHIQVGCSINKKYCSFFVNNDTTIPAEYQPFIFKRNFSTKDENRGLGTYSMRLIGENYLKGKVYFKTDELAGTTFFIDLPLSLNNKL
ncbi:MAG: HAMP domain-containing histidine kinase [Bacteroidales bacterium]|nr:HAMP domain-containing histidine kinase [Bacteroidales bacterium]